MVIINHGCTVLNHIITYLVLSMLSVETIGDKILTMLFLCLHYVRRCIWVCAVCVGVKEFLTNNNIVNNIVSYVALQLNLLLM